MESMEGFLLNLARSKDGARGDHQLRAWMAQVMELAYDSKNCVADYTQSGRARPRDRKGLMGHLQRLARLPKCILLRRRVAIRIRRLKVQAREVSERQQRYSVTAPPLPPPQQQEDDVVNAAIDRRLQIGQPSTHPARNSSRLTILPRPADILKEATGELLRWLEVKPEDYHTRTWPRVLAVVTPDGVNGAAIADGLYNHCKDSSSGELKFDRTVRITIQPRPHAHLLVILLDMLRQLHTDDYFKSMGNGAETWDLAQVKEKLKESLRGQKLLIVLSGLDYFETWASIRTSLETFECSAGSAVVLCTKDRLVAGYCSPDETKVYSLVDFYSKIAVSLLDPSKFIPDEGQRLRLIIEEVLRKCRADAYCTNLFLHALISNPNRKEQEFRSLSRSLDPKELIFSGSLDPKEPFERKNRMIAFCYQGLPKDYQNCLWYSTVFTRGIFKVRRASLLRWWVAEGLIKGVAEAERCCDALFTQDLLLPREVSGSGKKKSCGVNPLVFPMIKEAIKDETVFDTNQLPADDLELRFSIRNGIRLRQSVTKTESNILVDSMMPPKKNTNMEEQMKRMMKFLKSLPTSSSFRLLRVLELEGYKGFKKQHLKNICKIHQLKYLSLRNTDVVQFPDEIDHLLNLETLDIRGTRVQVVNAVLPRLKHLLAGRIDCASKEDIAKSKESFSTVHLPRGVAEMKYLEILSHVKVSNSTKELIGVGDKLQHLRKLGVVLCGKKANLDDLFLQIDKLNSLVSLSIRVEPPVNRDAVDAAVLTPPRSLESLHICGVRSWFPARIKELHQLTKITLRDTFLKDDALAVLGTLGSLLCLKLRYHAFAEATIIFRDGQFSNLMEVVIEDDNLRSIIFASGTAPKLCKMVWSFSRMECLSGVQHLSSLQFLDLNRGTCDSNGLRDLQRDINGLRDLQGDIPTKVHFNLNPPEDGQGSGGITTTTH
ncbi:hypothetical protein ACP70R_008672 [Stipagrostis hirtigluma subsp. patula]